MCHVYDPMKPSTYKGRLLIHSLGCETLARYMIDDIYNRKEREQLKQYLDAILDHHPNDMYYHVDLIEFDFTDIKNNELKLLLDMFRDYLMADNKYGLFTHDMDFRDILYNKYQELISCMIIQGCF